MTKSLLILGAGGHGQVVREAALKEDVPVRVSKKKKKKRPNCAAAWPLLDKAQV